MVQRMRNIYEKTLKQERLAHVTYEQFFNYQPQQQHQR